jgi:DNA-binding response OmpR family regulator
MPETMPLLLVTSHPQLRLLIRKILTRDGFTLVEAHDTRAALVALETFGAGIAPVIADDELSSMSGIALAIQAKQRQPGIPVLLLCGAISADECAAADAIVGKPFKPKELIQTVRTMLAGPVQ